MASKSPIGRGTRAPDKLRLASIQTLPCGDAEKCRIDKDGYRQLIEIAPEGVVIHQDSRIVYANQAAAEQFGADDPGEIVGRDGYDFVGPADHERIASVNKQLYEEGGQSQPARYQRLRLDGRITDVETVAVRIEWEGRPAILTMPRDIGARVRAEEHVRNLLVTGGHWLWETDADHRFTSLSEGTAGCGFTPADVYGKTRWELVGASMDDPLWRDHIADLDARRPFQNFEYRNTKPGGKEAHGSISGTPIFDIHGVFHGYHGISSDITERRKTQQTIAHMALHDALTKLPNRAYFADELERSFSAARRDGTKLAVLFLDLDHFKDINDTLGHSIGDKLLIEVAGRLKSCLRGGDLVARFGGDEFVMVVAQSCDFSLVSSLADRIIEATAEPYDIDGVTVHIGISIGIAIYPDDGLDIDRILANADLALYTAKRAGRQTWRVFDHRLQEQLQARRSLDQELRHALDRQQFELYYQPLINIADDRITGFEALIRWNHPKNGQRLPDTFIPATVQNRLIIPLTEWVLQEATTQLQRWAGIGLGANKIAVNISPSLLKLQGFVDLIDRCLAATSCDPRRITIEITEEALVDEGKIISALIALRKRGVTVAIDDFGMGYSSMARLKALPVDILKIDRSFLANVAIDANDASIVRSLVNVGHSLGKTVVAEGVETVQQLEFLKNVGCDTAQGFHINRPMPAADIPSWSERWQSSGR